MGKGFNKHQESRQKSGRRLTTLVNVSALVFACLFAPISIGQTVIYKTVHADGSITYSDKPSPGAVAITLDSPVTTIPGNTPKPSAPQAVTNQKSVEYSLSVSPEKEATIRNNLGEFTIRSQLNPARPGIYRITINGQQKTSTNGVFQFKEMDRGEYQYRVEFLDNTGKVLAFTQERKLFLHKASRLIRPAGQ